MLGSRCGRDERVPALGGATPRTASRREQTRPRLEAVLREFEHDAHVLARAGRPAPDLDRLRAELPDGPVVGATRTRARSNMKTRPR